MTNMKSITLQLRKDADRTLLSTVSANARLEVLRLTSCATCMNSAAATQPTKVVQPVFFFFPHREMGEGVRHSCSLKWRHRQVIRGKCKRDLSETSNLLMEKCFAGPKANSNIQELYQIMSHCYKIMLLLAWPLLSQEMPHFRNMQTSSNALCFLKAKIVYGRNEADTKDAGLATYDSLLKQCCCVQE